MAKEILNLEDAQQAVTELASGNYVTEANEVLKLWKSGHRNGKVWISYESVEDLAAQIRTKREKADKFAQQEERRKANGGGVTKRGRKSKEQKKDEMKLFEQTVSYYAVIIVRARGISYEAFLDELKTQYEEAKRAALATEQAAVDEAKQRLAEWESQHAQFINERKELEQAIREAETARQQAEYKMQSRR